MSTIIHGPSTSKQIERWWKELHGRLEKYFKHGLSWLKEERHYDPHNQNYSFRDKLAFVMIPLIQRQLDEFKDVVWNPYRIRFQKDTLIPDGIPNHIYDFPEKYNLESLGFDVTEDDLKTATCCSNALEYGEHFLNADFLNRFQAIINCEVNDTNYIESYLQLEYE